MQPRLSSLLSSKLSRIRTNSRQVPAGTWRLACAAVVSLCLWSIDASELLAQAPASFNGLSRPDATWVLGSSPKQSIPRFGLTRLEFDHGIVAQSDVDSVSDFKMDFANLTYKYQDELLLGNHCALVQRDGADTVAAHHRSFDTDSNDYETKKCNRGGGYGFQVLLPLSETEIFYTTEYSRDSDSPWIWETTEHAFTRLAYDSATSDFYALGPDFLLPFGDSLLEEALVYVPDTRGNWLGIARSATSDNFHLIEAAPDTVRHIGSIAGGPTHIVRERYGVRLHADPAGERLAMSGTDDGLYLFALDRASGAVSAIDSAASPPGYQPYQHVSDAEWSACGRFLYVTYHVQLWQYDTHDPRGLAASAVRIDDPDAEVYFGGYFEIERGPDCRMYIGWPGSAVTLSVIDAPSRKGRACDLKEQGLLLRSNNHAGLPNFPEYHLWGRDRVALGLPPIVDTAVCDSSIRAHAYADWTSSATESAVQAGLDLAPQWTLYPNPVRATRAGAALAVRLPQSLARAGEVTATLADAAGRKLTELLELQGTGDVRELRLPGGLRPGRYSLSLRDGRVPLGSSWVVLVD